MSNSADKSSHPELHPAVRIGHVHLRVADLERATRFYRNVLAFEVTAYGVPTSACLEPPFLSPGITTTT